MFDILHAKFQSRRASLKSIKVPGKRIIYWLIVCLISLTQKFDLRACIFAASGRFSVLYLGPCEITMMGNFLWKDLTIQPLKLQHYVWDDIKHAFVRIRLFNLSFLLQEEIYIALHKK